MVYSHRYPSSLWKNDDITWCNHDRLFMDSISERKSSMRSHSTTIFLWFSHGFPMVFLWGYIMPPRKTRPRLHDLPRPRRCKMRRPRAVAVASKPFWPMAWRVKEGRAKTWGKTWGKRAENGGTLKSLGTWGVFFGKLGECPVKSVGKWWFEQGTGFFEGISSCFIIAKLT